MPDEPETFNRQQGSHILLAKLQRCFLRNYNDPFDEDIIGFVLVAYCEIVTFEQITNDEN